MSARSGIGSGQLPLALRFPADQRFETFVAREPSPLPALQALAEGAGEATDADATRSAGARLRDAQLPGVYLAGVAGTGKSHLAIAVCAHCGQLGRQAAYMPLSSMMLSSAAGRLREALEHLHEYDLVALDGLEAVAGNADDELALFDFHNRSQDAGKALLYAARGMPAELGIGLPDLVSRLSQCIRIPLPPLDDAGRAQLLQLRAQRRGLQLEAGVIDWLLRRTGRDLANLTGLLDRLDKASLAAQRRITLPFLRQVLGDDGVRS